jgi:hypothetical protein
MPSKYGFGNTRKKSPYEMGKAHYGKDQKNPIPMLGDLDKDGKMSGYETARQTAIEKNMKKPAAPKMYGDKKNSMLKMYGKKKSMATKRKPMKEKSRAEQKAIFASGYKG